MKYKIITGDDLIEFEHKVNAYLAKGWIPQGGLVIVHDDSNFVDYFQALVKKGEK